jgi:hypothetical protein
LPSLSIFLATSGPAQIGDIGDLVGFTKLLRHAEALVALVGVGRQRDRLFLVHILLGEAFLVRQPHVRVHVDVALALAHALEDRGVVARHQTGLAADAAFNDFLQQVGNGLCPGPGRNTNVHLFCCRDGWGGEPHHGSHGEHPDCLLHRRLPSFGEYAAHGSKPDNIPHLIRQGRVKRFGSLNGTAMKPLGGHSCGQLMRPD